MKRRLTMAEARAAILAELHATGMDHVDPNALAIVPTGASWCATLQGNGARVDESVAVAVALVGRRLAAGYDLNLPAGGSGAG